MAITGISGAAGERQPLAVKPPFTWYHILTALLVYHAINSTN